MFKIRKLFLLLFLVVVLQFGCVLNSFTYAADTVKTYYTIYDGDTKNKVLFLKGEDVNIGDKYLSNDNNLYEIIKVRQFQ